MKKYFAYDSDNGFDTYETAEEAKAEAEDLLAYYRDDAGDGWDELAANVCWGEIAGQSIMIPLDDKVEIDGVMVGCVDYQLKEAK